MRRSPHKITITLLLIVVPSLLLAASKRTIIAPGGPAEPLNSVYMDLEIYPKGYPSKKTQTYFNMSIEDVRQQLQSATVNYENLHNITLSTDYQKALIARNKELEKSIAPWNRKKDIRQIWLSYLMWMKQDVSEIRKDFIRTYLDSISYPVASQKALLDLLFSADSLTPAMQKLIRAQARLNFTNQGYKDEEEWQILQKMAKKISPQNKKALIKDSIFEAIETTEENLQEDLTKLFLEFLRTTEEINMEAWIKQSIANTEGEIAYLEKAIETKSNEIMGRSYFLKNWNKSIQDLEGNFLDDEKLLSAFQEEIEQWSLEGDPSNNIQISGKNLIVTRTTYLPIVKFRICDRVKNDQGELVRINYAYLKDTGKHPITQWKEQVDTRGTPDNSDDIYCYLPTGARYIVLDENLRLDRDDKTAAALFIGREVAIIVASFVGFELIVVPLRVLNAGVRLAPAMAQIAFLESAIPATKLASSGTKWISRVKDALKVFKNLSSAGQVVTQEKLAQALRSLPKYKSWAQSTVANTVVVGQELPYFLFAGGAMHASNVLASHTAEFLYRKNAASSRRLKQIPDQDFQVSRGEIWSISYWKKNSKETSRNILSGQEKYIGDSYFLKEGHDLVFFAKKMAHLLNDTSVVDQILLPDLCSTCYLYKNKPAPPEPTHQK